MSVHSPSLTHTPTLHGTDRVLVRLGEFLAEAGRRHAVRRVERAAQKVERALPDVAARRRDAHQAAAVELGRDNAAQISPLGLR